LFGWIRVFCVGRNPFQSVYNRHSFTLQAKASKIAVMAENTNKGSATPAAVSEGSPKRQSKSVPETATTTGASASSLADDLMAGMGLTFAGVPDATGDETESYAQADKAGEKDQEQKPQAEPATDEPTDEAEAAKAEDEPEATFSEDGEPVLGSYEQSVVEALKSNPDFKGYAKRVAKAFELAVARREALAAKDGELAQKDETVKELEARLQETADNATMAPSGPLAHLPDKAALQAEVAKCADFLDWAESTPDAADAYKDTEQATAQQQLDYWKRYALNVLKNQAAQSKVFDERETVRAEVKKQRPTLFDARHAENKLLTDLYRSDPRTRADFDQWIADALRGRQLREQAAKSQAPGSLSRTATEAKAPEKKTVSKADLPRVKEVSALPLQKGGASPRESVEAKLKQHGGISFDEMADAGLLSRQAA